MRLIYLPPRTAPSSGGRAALAQDGADILAKLTEDLALTDEKDSLVHRAQGSSQIVTGADGFARSYPMPVESSPTVGTRARPGENKKEI